jgi:parallel beta-helix repeat protein
MIPTLLTLCIVSASTPITTAGSSFPSTALNVDRIVTEDLTLSPGEVLSTPLVIAADGITLRGNGAVIQGPGEPGQKDTLRGVGILLEGRRGIVIENLVVRGFETGLVANDCQGLSITGCNFSDNYHDPEHGWGDGERNGGIVLTRVSGSTFSSNSANRVWNGIDLWESNGNTIRDNDFSHCSNVCLKLWLSSRISSRTMTSPGACA